MQTYGVVRIMKIKKGSILECCLKEQQNYKTIYIYCGKCKTKSTANIILLNKDVYDRIGKSYNCFFRTSKYFSDFSKIKVIGNIGEQKANKLKEYYQKCYDRKFDEKGYLRNEQIL